MRKFVSPMSLCFFVLLACSFQTVAQLESASLEQCRNGAFETPDTCVWSNGTSNDFNSHWWEGDSVPYRIRFEGLTVGGSSSVTIEWDTTHEGKHAFDYLTNYNRTESVNNDPCSGVVPTCGAMTAFSIPIDPNVANAGVSQLGGQVFTMWGGTITQVSGYTLEGTYDLESSTKITITFTSNTSNPVLAWGAHVADNLEWFSLGGSASELSFRPYHMIKHFPSGGIDDVSISPLAIRRNSTITIIDQATPESTQVFGFTTSGDGLSNFDLVDDGVDNDSTPNSVNFKKLLAFGGSATYSITNSASGSYSLAGLSCSVSPGGTSDTSTNVPGRQVSITLQYGDNVTCTFNHSITTSEVCPQTIDQWKADPAAWPVNTLTLGGQVYSQAELLKLLSKRAGTGKNADASLILAFELIAAKLNVANGADASSIEGAIANADASLAVYTQRLPYRIKTSTAEGQQMVTSAGLLEIFNNGSQTPGCS